MKKILSGVLFAFLLTIIPFVKVNAASITVHNQDELKNALADSNIDTIVLGSDIETTEKINILRPVTIDGNGKTMRYVGTFGKENSKDNTVWGGIYVLQVYKTTATIKNIKLTGGNAGLLINGSKVNLVGTIDVSGNGFGGIELGQGSDVTETPELKFEEGSKVVNTTETEDRPTIWVPDDTDNAIIEIDGVRNNIESGEYVTLYDIASMTPVENPQTGDSIYLYITLLFMSLGTMLFSVKNLKFNNQD